MMRNSIDYKETGRKWKIALWASAAALLLTLTGCKNAQKDYEEGVTSEKMAQNDARIKSLKDSYEFYYQEIQRRQQNLLALEAAGDIPWARKERERIKELIAALKDTEEQIDKASNKKVDLEKYNQEGKVASETENAGWVWGIVIPPHRTFKETN